MPQQISAPGPLTRREYWVACHYGTAESPLGWRGHEQQPSRRRMKCIKQLTSESKYGVRSPEHTEPATLLFGVNVLKPFSQQGMDGGQENAEGQQQAPHLLS